MLAAPEDRLRDIWRTAAAGLHGDVSLELRSQDGLQVGINHDRRYYAASTIKIAVLAALLRDRREGKPRATGTITVHDTFTGATGDEFTIHQSDDQDDLTWAQLGATVELTELAERMITVSSNIATNLVLEAIGLDSVTDFLTDAGLSDQVTVGRPIGDSASEAKGITNTVTAAGLTALMCGLAQHTMLNAADSENAIAILARQQHRQGIPAGLPPGSWSASKSGWVDGIRHDTALVRVAGCAPTAFTVCTQGLPDDHAAATIARLTRATFQELSS